MMTSVSTERRVCPRIKVAYPVHLKVEEHFYPSSNLTGQTTDIGERGLALTLQQKLTLPSIVSIYLNSIPSFPSIPAKAEVLWGDSNLINRDKTFRYGLRFLSVDIDSLRKLIGEINSEQIENYFESSIPNLVREKISENYILEKLDQKQIMEIIDFKPPFLKIEKMVVLGFDKQVILNTKGLGTGILTTGDTRGHYNDTIFLAQCGWLMGSMASIYLAALFPSTAPQVIEVDRIKPSMDKILWKPSSDGSRFFIEVRILKKKLQVVVVNVKITFGEIFMGEVEKLKLALTPKSSIWSAKELPKAKRNYGS